MADSTRQDDDDWEKVEENLKALDLTEVIVLP